MSFLALFAISWTAFYLFIDFHRLRELYPSGLLSSFLGIWTDLIMVKYKLWEYKSPGFTSLTIPLLLDWSIYPVVAMLYVQWAPRRFRLTSYLLYTLCWVLAAVLLEWYFLRSGDMMYLKWWKIYYSFASDWIIFSIVYVMHRFFRRYTEQKKNT